MSPINYRAIYHWDFYALLGF
ncbi:hypothetical protein [Enterococcus faecium]|nr:hypothetical protein [Enterococcus faecium]MDO7986530.1 hypothetical protein [Enterococcus faecium]